MRVLDLFAGIGGFSLAAHWAGWETAAFVEWDKFCQKVLTKNFPDVPIYGDIKDFHYEQEKEQIGPVDLICGGFPCQPFSHAGNRNGTSDDRYLWPEMLRVIGEVKPTWVVGENVAGLLSMDGGAVFEEVCASLESEGYTVEAFVLPAISRGSPHRRDRVWIVGCAADASGSRTRIQNGESEPGGQRRGSGKNSQPQMVRPENGEVNAEGLEPRDRDIANSEITEREQPRRTRPGREGFADGSEQSRLVGVPNKPRLEGHGGHDERSGERVIGATGGEHTDQWREHWYEAATRLCRIHDGIPGGLDEVGGIPGGTTLPKKKNKAGRAKRLKALGNAVVPQVVYEIFRAIEAHELSIKP